MGGCSLDDQELDRLEAERLASSAAASASASARPGSRDDRGLPLSWRAAKASEAKGCGKAECACKADAGVAPAAPMPRRNCGKCRDKLAQVASRQGDALCAECLWEVTHAKVRHAVRISKVVKNDDRVLVAYSGGCSSRALTHYLQAVHTPRTARIVRGRLNFDLAILYIDEGAAWGLSESQSVEAVSAARASVAAYSATVPFVSATLEDVYAPAAAAIRARAAMCAAHAEDGVGTPTEHATNGEAHNEAHRRNGTGIKGSASASSEGSRERKGLPGPVGPTGVGGPESAGDPARRRKRLQRLLAAVKDGTGREDLVAYLRRKLILDLAVQMGYNKVALGNSSTAQAAHIMAALSKGSGYALPADLHFLDSRLGPGQPTVVQPVKELSARDMAMVCHLRRLPLAPLPLLGRPSRPSVNTLCREFVAGMQAGLPSTISTIVRTASKLKGFEFNRPETEGTEGTVCPTCCLCNAPLADVEVQALVQSAGAANPPEVRTEAVCCRSCQQSIMCHLDARTPVASPASGTAATDREQLLPPHIARQSDAMWSAARQATSAAALGGPTAMTAQDLRDRMRASISDLLLSDDDEI